MDAYLLERRNEPDGLESETRTGAEVGKAGLTTEGGGIRFSLNTEIDGREPDHRGSSRSRDDTPNRFSLGADAMLSDGIQFKFEGETVELWNFEAEKVAGFRIGESDQWKRVRISDVNVTLGLMDDRLRLTTRHSSSRYMDSEWRDEEFGQGLVQRIDADLWKSEDFRLGLFGSYAGVGPRYHHVDEMGDEKKSKKKKNDPFLNPGRQTAKFGGTIGFGPADLTLTSLSESAFGDEDDDRRESGYEAKLSLNLDRLRNRASDLFGEGVRVMTPGSLWMSYGSRDIDLGDGDNSPADRATDYTIGASWNWGGPYGSVSYWRSYYDNRQLGSEGADWQGDGLDLSLGYYGSNWSFDGGFSMNRSNNLDIWSESHDAGYSGWLSFSLRPEDLPDLTTSLGSDVYRADYIAYDGISVTYNWKLGTELDFSKYLTGGGDGYDPSLKVVFQMDQDNAFDEWGGVTTTDLDTDFFIGFRFALTAPK